MAVMRPTGPLKSDNPASGSFEAGAPAAPRPAPPRPPRPPATGASSPPLTPPRPAIAPAFFAASGYISIAASTDAPVQPALGATHGDTVVPVWPKQSASLPGIT